MDRRSGSEAATFTLADLQASVRDIAVNGKTFTLPVADARMLIARCLREAALTARFSGTSLDEVFAGMERKR
jgi:hypothetical protein